MFAPNGAAIYGVPWIPSIYPIYVSIYTSTMDPLATISFVIIQAQELANGAMVDVVFLNGSLAFPLSQRAHGHGDHFHFGHHNQGSVQYYAHEKKGPNSYGAGDFMFGMVDQW